MKLPFAGKSKHTRRRKQIRNRRLKFESLEDRHLLATFMVSNLDDSGPGSLRQAVLEANAATGADEIEFQAGLAGSISLTSGQIRITDDLTIAGPGAKVLTIDAQQNSRIFNVIAANAVVDGVTLTGGQTTGEDDGGAMRADAASLLTVRETAITGNSSSSSGGAISADHLVVIRSTVWQNRAYRDGGGIHGGEVTIVNSTISGNVASLGRGGGVFARAHDSSVVVLNSTIYQNGADASGGGIYADDVGSLTVRSSIVASNKASIGCTDSIPPSCFSGPPDIARAAPFTMTNSLLGNSFGTSFSPAPVGSPDADGNIIGSNFLLGGNTIPAGLERLADNGGPTMTHMPRADSPVIDAGANPLNLATDQRGFDRGFGVGVDMGAVEQQWHTFVVNSFGDGGDANPGDGICDDGTGDCTLRAAIEEANASPNGMAPDEIVFNLPGGGLATIRPLSELPAITDPIDIDGATRPGNNPFVGQLSFTTNAPMIELDGSLAGEGASGLTIRKNGGGSSISGLVINRFDRHGIFTSRSDGNQVARNYLGTNADGTMAAGNGDAGVMINNGTGNIIGGVEGFGNVISGNRRGVVIAGRLASGNHVSGNLIGTDATGTRALGNRTGVEIAGAAGNMVGSLSPFNYGSFVSFPDFALLASSTGISCNNTIGPCTFANIISGNRVGVEIRSASATDNTVIYNRIGTDVSGEAGVPNRTGVSIRNGAAGNRVLGNRIAANTADGIRIIRADGNEVGGNQIGIDGLGNGGDGIDIRGGQNNVVTSGLTASAPVGHPILTPPTQSFRGNKITANARYGILVNGDGNEIESNMIGAFDDVSIGNQRGGVQILKSSHNVVRGNSIFKNNGPGVLINGSAAQANLVQGNRIGGLGQELIGLVSDKGNFVAADLGNIVGIEIRNAHDNVIGGQAPPKNSPFVDADFGNQIVGNQRYGIHIRGDASGNRVVGNVIGVKTTITYPPPPLAITNVYPPVPVMPIIRTVPAPNGLDGVFVEADGNLIGGTLDGDENVISGNGRNGILLMGDGNRVQGNRIGGRWLFLTLPNVADGVRVRGSNNVIGGTQAGAANTISFNARSGVRVSSGTGNVISQNSVFDNGGLGIDLGRQGTNANDAPLDADRGANNLQNTPHVLTTRQTATHLQIIFHIPSQSPHSTYPIRAEFFAADADGEEGKAFLAAAEVLLPTATGISIPLADLPPGGQLVATATDADGNTSEFSAPLAIAAQQAAAADTVF